MDWAKKLSSTLKVEELTSNGRVGRFIVEMTEDDFEPVISLIKARNGKVCHWVNLLHSMVVEVDPGVLPELAQMKQVKMINPDFKVAHCQKVGFQTKRSK